MKIKLFCLIFIFNLTSLNSEEKLNFLNDLSEDIKTERTSVKFSFFLAENKKLKVENLRGSVTIIFPKWQKISRVQEELVKTASMHLVKKIKNENLNGGLYRYQNKKEANKLLICAFVQKKIGYDDFFLDFCYIPDDSKNALTAGEKIIQSFKNENKLKSFFLPGKNFFSGFYESHNTESSIKLPSAFYLIEEKDKRYYLSDTAGLVQAEFFKQKVPLIQEKEVSEQVYINTIKKTMKEQGGWNYLQSKIIKVNNSEKNICLIFSTTENTGGNYCFVDFYKEDAYSFRLIFIAVYNNKMVNSLNLAEYQLRYMTELFKNN